MIPVLFSIAAELTACGVLAAPVALAQGSVFQSIPVDEANFILVSAPIGKENAPS